MESSKEGDIWWGNFSFSGLLVGDMLMMCLYGNFNRIDVDSWDINFFVGIKNVVGWEGVINKDINSVFLWKMIL